MIRILRSCQSPRPFSRNIPRSLLRQTRTYTSRSQPLPHKDPSPQGEPASKIQHTHPSTQSPLPPSQHSKPVKKEEKEPDSDESDSDEHDDPELHENPPAWALHRAAGR